MKVHNLILNNMTVPALLRWFHIINLQIQKYMKSSSQVAIPSDILIYSVS